MYLHYTFDPGNSYLSLQEMTLGEVVGGPESCLSYDLFIEIQTGNSLYKPVVPCTLTHEQSVEDAVTHFGGFILANMHICWKCM